MVINLPTKKNIYLRCLNSIYRDLFHEFLKPNLEVFRICRVFSGWLNTCICDYVYTFFGVIWKPTYTTTNNKVYCIYIALVSSKYIGYII